MSGPTHRLPGLVLVEHVFELPLDPSARGGRTIEVFAREVVAAEREAEREKLPWLLFLQGGPGFGAPRPPGRTGWLARAVEEFRVLLLDQRGTGRSAPVTARSLAALGSARAQAEYLAHFRADGIVADCEAVRARLTGGAPWSVLGQSYGGFCATHYLSRAPEGLREALIAGGLPPLVAHADDVYRRTYPVARAKNELYYQRYPEDAELVRSIVDLLEQNDVRLPSGDRLSARRFQTLGLLLGFSDGFETIHYLLENALLPGESGLSHAFLKGFEGALQHDTNPIFSILHEACYTQGSASRWSAERVRAEFPEFDVRAGQRVLLTGEMIYPWLFEEVGALRPLAEAARLLAERADWPPLYDPAVLARNAVPCAAAVYFNDMYVERELSLRTAGAIRGLRTWITDELEHNGLRSDGERVLTRLLQLARGRA